MLPPLTGRLSSEIEMCEAIRVRKRLLLLLLPLSLLLIPQAKADTIGPGGCASCLSSSYSLGYTATASPDVFNIYLLINATGYSNGSTDRLNSVALKLVSQSSSIDSVSLIGSPIPTGFTTTVLTGLNANGCAGGGGGFFCSETTAANHGLEVAHAGDVYLFEWSLNLTDPSKLLTGLDAASVKALYVTASGQQHGITSEEITLSTGIPTTQTNGSPVPEPSSLLLLGTGMIGAAAAIRRKLFA